MKLLFSSRLSIAVGVSAMMFLALLVFSPSAQAQRATVSDEASVCGEDKEVTVIGKNSGVVYGSGPAGDGYYAFNSSIASAAVHAGLLEIGASSTIRVIPVGKRTQFTGVTRNGIKSLDLSSSRSTCAITFEIVGEEGETDPWVENNPEPLPGPTTPTTPTSPTTPGNADTLRLIADLQRQVAVLTEMLMRLINAGGTPTIPGQPGSTVLLTENLQRGSSGPQVTALQRILASIDLLDDESISGYFGPLTEAAVKKFQCQKNIVCQGTPNTTGYGAVGPSTRLALNGIRVGGPLPPTPSPTPFPSPTPSPTPSNCPVGTVITMISSAPWCVPTVPGQCPAGTVLGSFSGKAVCNPTPGTGGPVFNFTTASYSVEEGTVAKLNWYQMSGATSCKASGDWSGSKSPTGGSENVTINHTRTFVLTCTGTSGSATTKTVTISIAQSNPNAPGITLKANGSIGPVTVPWDTDLDFTWSSNVPVTNCRFGDSYVHRTFSPASGTSGSLTEVIKSFTPQTYWNRYGGTSPASIIETDYAMSCSHDGNSLWSTVRVNSVPVSTPVPGNPAISSFTSDKTRVSLNDPVNFSWTSTNATYCSLSMGDVSREAVAVSGSKTKNIGGAIGTNGKINMVLSCNNIAGVSVSQTIQIDVTTSPSTGTASIGYLSSTGNLSTSNGGQRCVIPIGGSSCGITINWTTTNAVSAKLYRAGNSTELKSGLIGSHAFTNLVPNSNSDVNFVLEVAPGNTQYSNILGAVCATGSAWSGSICMVDGPVAGPSAMLSLSETTGSYGTWSGKIGHLAITASGAGLTQCVLGSVAVPEYTPRTFEAGYGTASTSSIYVLENYGVDYPGVPPAGWQNISLAEYNLLKGKTFQLTCTNSAGGTTVRTSSF